MTEATRRDRSRVDTDRQIRQVARTLLISRGAQGVTLRAIAREMGITAPALYRYYDSFDDLIRQVCADICVDLADELAADLAAIPVDDAKARVFAVCRGFRSWSVRHPREFTLVFASPTAPGTKNSDDQFGRIFVTVAAQVLASQCMTVPADEDVPEHLHGDLADFRAMLSGTLRETGIDLPAGVFTLGTAYTMLRFWVRLYGQVALEVFGRVPYPVSDPEALFEAMIAELAAEVGLT